MLILLKRCEVISSGNKGVNDILIGSGKILAIAKEISIDKRLEVDEVDCLGLKALPGLIDAHVHIAGAGGEGGPASRTPELRLSSMIEAGVTTVVGSLGTDGITRSVESVLMKVKSLRQQGVSAWMFTGSYQIPPPTILGSVAKDIALIDEVIGVGEIAIADHRSSFPTTEELVKLALQARVGGMLGGKSGIVNIHMGDAMNPFRQLYEAVNISELKLSQFWPTHCNRNHYIFQDAKEYGKKSHLDLTTSSYPYFPDDEIKTSKAIAELLKAGVSVENITVTSDACGSLPGFDENGNLVRLEMGLSKSVFTEIVDCVLEEKIPIENAIKVATENVARILKLANKGRIEVGKDADLILLNQDFQIVHYLANGIFMKKNFQVLKVGNYE
ncbi:MAG TPA: beta-aspartyl-peptidase [Salinivirgaceae bacterium]|nr:beta-aspartyl-peptidase [Salinivirgaceae bacterium]